MPARLLALDLDGTLLRPDGSIDPRDADAIRRALATGVHVTIATGRVSTGTLPTAQALGLDVPLVCADGGLLVAARTGERLEQQAIQLSVAESVMRAFSTYALIPFVLLHDSVHCDEAGREHSAYVSVWTTVITVHPSLATATAWRRDGEVALAVGIGTRDGVETTMNALLTAHPNALDLVRFKVNRGTGHWALLARPFGCNKGAGLARVASRLGVAREHTAAVGDWHNDIPIFAWVARSFAMGQAPEPVRNAATDALIATNATGGGVAEAIERWLG